MDLSNLSVAELHKLQEDIKEQLKKREREEITQAREKILAIAQSVGVSVKDLIGTGIRTKAAVPVQYRNPNDVSQKWTGRGRQPKWIKEWIESGKSLDLVRI